MGTEYRVANKTKKEVYGFGLKRRPKYGEALANKDCALFLLFITLQECYGDTIKVISDGNSWDWSCNLKGFDQYEDKTEEMQRKFQAWKDAKKHYWKERGEA